MLVKPFLYQNAFRSNYTKKIIQVILKNSQINLADYNMIINNIIITNYILAKNVFLLYNSYSIITFQSKLIENYICKNISRLSDSI